MRKNILISGASSGHAAPKAGLLSLSEGTRADLLRTSIRLTPLRPGLTDSEMTADKWPPLIGDSPPACAP